MTRFESKVLGLAKVVADIDCGASHGGNWRLPCPACIEQERAGMAMLQQEISSDSVRRHMRLGHDQRDGNRPIKRRLPTEATEDGGVT